jgi:hypothetical protein
MDLKKLKAILINDDLPDDHKKYLIIKVLSDDKEVIPMILEILDVERENKKELIIDLNLELSRAHIMIEMLPESKKKLSLDRQFVLDKIAEFYIKWKGKIRHCFNRFN